MDSDHTQPADLDVFISYSRRDVNFVDRLQLALRARGVRAAVDRTDIEKAEAWWGRVEELIRESDAVVFVLSPDSIRSNTCEREVEFAESLNKRFAPIVAREVGDKHVPAALARLNYIHFTGVVARDPHAYDDAVDDLARALRIDLAWVREHTRLGALAARWATQQRSTELTLRGSELKRAESWVVTQPPHAPTPTNLHHAFIVASRQAATWRQRLFAILSFGGLLIASALAGVALWQWGDASNNARIAKANEELAKTNEQRAITQRNIVFGKQLGTQAQTLLTEGVGTMQSLGVLLAVEGMRLHPTVEATTALQQAVRLRARVIFEGPSCEFCVVGYYSAFSPDSRFLAVTGTPARVIDISRKTVMSLGPSGNEAVPAKAIAYDPTGKYIATFAGGRDVTLWSADAGAVVRQIRSPGQMDGPIVFSNQGDRLAVAADRADVEILSVPALETVKRFKGQTKSKYVTSSSLSFDIDDTTLAQTVGGGNEVVLWTLRDGKSRTIKLDAQSKFAVFSAIDNKIAIGAAGTVRVLDPKTGTERARVGQTESRDMMSVAFADYDTIVGAVGWDGPAKVWDTGSGEEIHRFEHERPAAGGAGRIASMSISSDGETFATNSDDMILRIWQPDKPNLSKWRSPPTDAALLDLAGGNPNWTESEDRRVCLAWEGSTARARDCESRSQIYFTVSTKQPIRSAAVTQTGRYAAILDWAGQVLMLDAAGREIGRIEAPGATAMTMDEHRGILALLSPEQGLRYVSFTGGPVPPPLADIGKPSWARFSESGAHILSSQNGTLINLHEVATGRTVAQAVHDSPVDSVLWLEEPRYFATASRHDGTARVWDTQANTLILQWRLSTNLLTSEIGVSPDGRYFWFSGRYYNSQKGGEPRSPPWRYGLWRPDDLVQAACLTITRELSDDEWQRYLPQPAERRASCPNRKPAGLTEVK